MQISCMRWNYSHRNGVGFEFLVKSMMSSCKVLPEGGGDIIDFALQISLYFIQNLF